MKPMNEADVTANRLRRYAIADCNVRPSESYPQILARFDVDGVDEADARRIALHDDRAGAGAVAEEADAAHQRAVGDAGGSADDAFARREILRGVGAARIGNAHRPAALLVLGLLDHQPRENLAVQ